MQPKQSISKLINETEAYTKGDPDHFRDMPENEQKAALDWIKTNIYPGKKVWESRSSYGLKHDFEHKSRIYMTNNQFKEAMLLCGFKPVDETELNWYYRIDRKSPICVEYRKRW